MPRHHTKDKGDIGVVAVKFDLIRRGFHVLSSETEHAPFDLVTYDEETETFQRVQVKYRTLKNGAISVAFKSTWADRHGVHDVPMNKDLIDVIAVYCPETNGFYYFDPHDFGKSVYLRITPTRSGQRKGIAFADDYREFPPKRAVPLPELTIAK